MNSDEIQSEQVFPKIHIGKANPVSEGELTLLLDKLLDMETDVLKDTLVGLANRKNVEMKDKELLKAASN